MELSFGGVLWEDHKSLSEITSPGTTMTLIQEKTNLSNISRIMVDPEGEDPATAEK